MNEAQNIENLSGSQLPINKKKPNNRLLFLVREVLAILIWIFVVTKLFIFDIDIFLVEKLSPGHIWLINYKFFILIGIIAIIFLVTKNRHIFLWSLYVFFYPVILLLWRIPLFIFKKRSWNLVFALIDSIISFFKSFKLTFIITAFYLISVALIFGVSNKILLWISLVVLFIILLWAYIQRIILVFKPSGVYQVYSKIFAFFGEFVQFRPGPSGNPGILLDEKELELSIENMDEIQLQKWTTGVQWPVIFNRICLFVAKKFKSYQDSRFNIVSSVFSILILVFFTVLSFAIINFGLFRINQHFFLVSSVPTFFNFIYYSFNNILFNTIREIIATTPISQVVSMIESLFALFLLAILVSLVLSVRSQRETDELNDLIRYLTEEGMKTEGYLKDKYRYNIEEAMQALQKLNVYSVVIINKITEMLD